MKRVGSFEDGKQVGGEFIIHLEFPVVIIKLFLIKDGSRKFCFSGALKENVHSIIVAVSLSVTIGMDKSGMYWLLFREKHQVNKV